MAAATLSNWGSAERWARPALLASVSLAALIATMPPAAADEIIDGTTVTIPGTYPSPWAVSGQLIVGNAAVGVLDVVAGGVVTSDLGNIGNQAGSNGTVTVTSGSWTTGSFELHVGTDGSGTLNVEAGGLVQSGAGIIGYNGSSTGTATVTGQNSRWDLGTSDLFIGFSSAAGSLNIEAGGSASSGNGFIGYNVSSSGTVTVTGDASTWDLGTSSLSVGYGGTGTLNIEDGATVTSGYSNIGVQSTSTSTATVTGNGSTWDLGSAVLGVGYLGNGTLNIQSGGSVKSGDGVIGYLGNSTGAAVVTGQDSTWNTGTNNILVGQFGSGTLTIEDGGEVIAAKTFVGNEAGSSGTLILNGSNTARGVLTTAKVVKGAGTASLDIDGGVLKVADEEIDYLSNFSLGDVNILAGGAFIDTNGYDIGISAELQGVGGITKQGQGVMTLTGTSIYTGATVVESGKLIVNGSIATSSGVTVEDGASLGGSGTVSSLRLSSGAKLTPGNSIGTLNAASATFDAGSTYEVEVDSSGASDLLNVSGITTINGGKVVVVPYPGYAVNTLYTIVTSAGGVTGTFDAAEASASSLFLSALLSYDANNVYLELYKQPFVSIARTTNQQAVATGAESLGQGNAVYDALLDLTAAGQARQAYDALSGEVHASVAGVLTTDSRYVRDAVFARLLQASYAGRDAMPVALAASGPGMSSRMSLGATDRSAPSVPAVSGLTFWAQGYGAWGSIDGNGNAASVDRTLGGFVSGVDAGLGGGWRAGIGTGYARSDLNVDARLSSGDIDSYHLIGYVGGIIGDFALRGGGAWTWSNVETQRSVIFPGFYDRDTAGYGGNTGQVFGEVALPLGYGATAWEPFARLAYVHVETGAFTESGGAAALASSDVDQSLGLSTLGVRMAATMHIAGAEVVPHASLAWQHAFGDVEPAATLAFASGGAAFTVLGAPLAPDSALLDVGLTVSVAPDATLGLAYSGQLASDATDNAVTGRFNWQF